jgi:DNA-directed RNA polymerase subunit F
MTTKVEKKLFTLEEAEKVLADKAEQKRQAKLEEKRQKAIKHTELSDQFKQKVLDLYEIHNQIVNNNNDWVSFTERFKEHSPERADDWEESWEESSC